MAEGKEIVVSDGRGHTWKHRRALERMGFSKTTAYAKSAWVLRIDGDPKKEKRIRKFCRSKRLNVSMTDINLTRASGYRKAFMESLDSETVRCAYCGKKLYKEDMTVDHIIPVNGVRNNKMKIWRKVLRIENINEVRNLAPSCYRCNQLKSNKGGLWIIRGYIGKHQRIRLLMNVIKTIVVSAAIVIVIFAACKAYISYCG